MLFDMLETMPYTTNCYLIGDETAKVCALVDPGGSLEKILEMVQSRGLTLEKILLTHGHYDHVGQVSALLEVYPMAAVYLHRLDHREDDKRLYPPPTWGFNHFEDGSHLSVGSIDVQVLHTPGHSPGSLTRQAVAGMLCGGTHITRASGRGGLTRGGDEALQGSLARLGRLEGDCKVCPGHGPASTLERERRTNPCLRQALGL